MLNVPEPDTDQHQRKTPVKPWLSALRDVPKCIPSPLKCPDFSDLEGNAENTPEKTPAGEQARTSKGLSESPCKERRSDSHKNNNKKKRQTQRKTPRPSIGSPVKGKHLTETNSPIIPEDVTSSNTSEKGKEKIKAAKFITQPVIPYHVNNPISSTASLSSPVSPVDAVVKQPLETFTPSGKKERRTPRPSRLPSLVQSVTLSGASQSTASISADGDNVFEDYFSPANSHRKTERLLLPYLPLEGSIPIPFKLDSEVPKKRKHRSCESTGFGANNNKKKKLKHSSGKNQQPDKESAPQIDSHQGVEGAITNVTHAAKKGRWSTLPSIKNSTSDATKRGRASTSSSKFMARNTSSDLQKNSVNDLCHTTESE